MSQEDDDTLTIQKPKKDRTAKQIEATNKMVLASKSRALGYKKAIKAGVIEHLNSGVELKEDSSSEEEVAPKAKPLAPTKPDIKAKPLKKEPTIVYQDASSSDEEVVIVKKKKKKKKTIIYEESSSEEEPVKPPQKTRDTKTQQNSKSGFTVHTKPATPPAPQNCYYFAD